MAELQQALDRLNANMGDSTSVLVPILLLLLIGNLAYWILRRRAEEHSRKHLFPLLLEELRRPAWLLFMLISANIVTHYGGWLSEENLDRAEHVITLGFIGLGGWALLAVINALRIRMIKRYDITTADNFQARKMHTQVSLLYRLLSFLVILITLAMMLTTFEEVNNLGRSLLASAGVAGIIIGFAAQKTIGSVFAGIQIAITQPIRIEDAVVLEGEWGWVEEITLTYVVIRIWDKRRLIVPITYFIEKPFQNWTRREAEIIGTVVIHTDFSVPVEAMRAELDRLLDATPLWNKNVKVLQVIDTTPREVVLRALMSGRDSPQTWDLRCYVREGLIAWLQQHYPHALPRTRMQLSEGQISGDAFEKKAVS